MAGRYNAKPAKVPSIKPPAMPVMKAHSMDKINVRSVPLSPTIIARSIYIHALLESADAFCRRTIGIKRTVSIQVTSPTEILNCPLSVVGTRLFAKMTTSVVGM